MYTHKSIVYAQNTVSYDCEKNINEADGQFPNKG